MKRKLIFLNFVLLALAALAAWQLRARWVDAGARQRQLLRQPSKIAVLPPALVFQSPGPATASSYGEVAQKTLFSSDRNPNVVIEAPPPKPVPAFPAAYGVMDFGRGPTAILSEKAGDPSRRYAPGDKIGEFTLVSLEGEKLEFEWDGKRFVKTVRELKPTAPVAASSAAPAAQAAASTATTVTPVTARVVPSDAGPGAQYTTEMRACVQGDTAPAGAVRDGYRKVMNPSPFAPSGYACFWELIK